MIEPIIYFGIGFLVAALIGLVIIPLVHGRAVRLTMRRLEAATPVSVAEIQADKDQLRAEFAMSMRRLEMNIEQLQAKNTAHLAELGNKSDAINRLKIELGEKTAAIFALEAREKELRDHLQTSEANVERQNAVLQEAERALAEKEGAFAQLTGELNQQTAFSETQKAEIAALNAQIEALKEQLAAAAAQNKAVEDRREAERLELLATMKELQEERA